MAACKDIQDCLANGCDISPMTLSREDLGRFIGPNAVAADEPYIEIRGNEVVLDGVFTFSQIVRLGAFLGR